MDQLDWSTLVRSGLTIVVMMGARRAAEIRERLIAGGLSPTPPAAIATSATHPSQQIWHGSLEQLGRQTVIAPAVLIIGDAACRRPSPDSAYDHPVDPVHVTS